MRHVLEEAASWQRSRARFAMATVVRTWDSAPHAAGASMLVGADGRVVGSVSGGCVEAAVYDLAHQALAEGRPARESWGVADGDAFAIGLTCGGTIEVFVREITGDVPAGRVAADLADGVPVALVTVLDAASDRSAVGRSLAMGPRGATGTLGSAALDRAAAYAAETLLARGESGTIRLGDHPGDALCNPAGPGAGAAAGTGTGVELLVQAFAAPPRLLVFGAADFARPLVRIGALLGHRVTLCDARPAFVTPGRFPEAHELVVDWPHRWFEARRHLFGPDTAVCVLTHDAKFDVPLLRAALRSRAGYVGAMGSRRTHEDRLERLREAGVSEGETARLRSPIGLDLGGRGPEETAVSIAAEIVALRRGGSGLPLTGLGTPIHNASF
jgi:xanthine dehydrogenase accessory factor